MKMKKLILSIGLVALIAAPLSAASVFKLSLYNDIALFNNATVSGLDLGIATTTQKVNGIQFALLSSSSDLDGMQIGYIWADCTNGVGGQMGIVTTAGKISSQMGAVSIAKEVNGGQTGFLVALADKVDGSQFGIVTYAKAVQGTQYGYVNICQGSLEGLQIGGVNYADSMKSGLQIGLVNICSNAAFPAMVFINFKM